MNEFELIKNGFGFSIGAVIMLFAAEIFHWYGYLKANPSVGEVSTTPWFFLFYVVIFSIGTIIAYTFFMRGLTSILATITDK